MPPILLLEYSFEYHPPIYVSIFQVASFLRSPTKILYTPLLPPHTIYKEENINIKLN